MRFALIAFVSSWLWYGQSRASIPCIDALNTDLSLCKMSAEPLCPLLCDSANPQFYQPSQIDLSTGLSWCVNTVTGMQINGTLRTAVGERLPCDCKSMRQMDNRDGVSAYCPIQSNATEIGGINDSGDQVYCPQCDSMNTDLFNPMQTFRWLSWCVDKVTGIKLNGTEWIRSNNAQLDCSCDGMRRMRNIAGVSAYCKSESEELIVSHASETDLFAYLYATLVTLFTTLITI